MDKKSLEIKLNKMGFDVEESIDKLPKELQKLMEQGTEFLQDNLTRIRNGSNYSHRGYFKLRAVEINYKNLEGIRDIKTTNQIAGVSYLIIEFEKDESNVRIINGYFQLFNNIKFTVPLEGHTITDVLDDHFNDIDRLRRFCFGKNVKKFIDTIADFEESKTVFEDSNDIDDEDEEVKEDKSNFC